MTLDELASDLKEWASEVSHRNYETALEEARAPYEAAPKPGDFMVSGVTLELAPDLWNAYVETGNAPLPHASVVDRNYNLMPGTAQIQLGINTVHFYSPDVTIQQVLDYAPTLPDPEVTQAAMNLVTLVEAAEPTEHFRQTNRYDDAAAVEEAEENSRRIRSRRV